MKTIFLPLACLITFSFAEISNITKLTLETNTSTLNLEEKAKLTLIATYQDSSTKPITNNIEWIVNSPNSIEINATTLTALKDGKITLQAKGKNIVSNSLTLDITWIVNGHNLPPEPDKALNDSTLLGIDVNDNGFGMMWRGGYMRNIRISILYI